MKLGKGWNLATQIFGNANFATDHYQIILAYGNAADAAIRNERNEIQPGIQVWGDIEVFNIAAFAAFLIRQSFIGNEAPGIRKSP
jgi:hypothetical protein